MPSLISPGSTIVFLTILLSTNLKSQAKAAAPLYHSCQNNTLVFPSSNYGSNLNLLLSSLASNVMRNRGFYNDTVGHDLDKVQGLCLCRGDATRNICQECVKAASEEILKRCPNSKEAIIWYDMCMLRYSNRSFFGALETTPRFFMWNSQNKSQPDDPSIDSRFKVYGLMLDVPNSTLMYGTDELRVNESETRYCLAQCTRELSSEACSQCFKDLTMELEFCCEGTRGWHILAPSCSLRYDSYPFYRVNADQPNKEKTSDTKRIVIITIVAASVAVALLSCFFFYLRKRYQAKKGISANHQGVLGHGLQTESGVEFSHSCVPTEDSLDSEFPVIPLSVIRLSTGDFSMQNKIGEGGFGPVYKGILPDGRQIAVKRLSRTSGQGLEEFKNEVIFIAKLQHKNLVRVWGGCIEKNEKLLVYEYMPNASLNVHLFDSVRCAQLDWKSRLSIISGIAKGLLYLHEDSRLKIIHRDLKASNILLDHEMNPKISDFGLARTFKGDQNSANTRRIMGTYGYMAPEYAMHGLFSVKSDVFSFGVILLEIISGQRNNGFHFTEHGQSLLVYAWRLWCEGQALEFVDSSLGKSYVTNEVLKCIHIGLLCVQEDAADRPTMSTVGIMLASDTVNLPRPTQPAFSVGRMFTDQSSSGSKPWSINGVTVTNVEPR